jgi:universal stress protein A
MATPYKKVLIAVDGSDDADQVLEGATELDRRGSENCHVVTVVPPIVIGVSGLGGASFAASWPLQDMEATMAREITDSVRERVARFGIPPERVTVLHGRPATEIAAHAEAIQADLIVIGSHGRKGMSRVMLGSTANGVLHGAECDVLTIRIRE